MVAAGRRAIGRSPRWIGALVGELRAHFRAGPLDRPGELAHRIRQSDSFHRGLERAAGQGHPVRVVRLRAEPTRMVRRPWPVPVVDDVAALARQLELISDHLTWLSDPAGMQRRTPDGPHHPYHYSWLTRPGAAPRLLESPTPILRATMRRVLRDILVWVPAHDAAHGFVPGRSALTHAANHVGQETVLSADLRHFFAAVSAARIRGIFTTMGYPEPVARCLTGLVTNRTPVWVLAQMPPGGDSTQRHLLRARLRQAHLPQGGPTSPALANLVCFHLDARLSGYAEAADAHYTRYADDLTFSGSAALRRHAAPFVRGVGTIVADEGFALNPAKTRVEGRGDRQQVTGIVVNEQLGVPRREYDRLRAILHDAHQHGPQRANRLGHAQFREHLNGRIGWVESVNAARGERLRARFDSIDWGEHLRP